LGQAPPIQSREIATSAPPTPVSAPVVPVQDATLNLNGPIEGHYELTAGGHALEFIWSATNLPRDATLTLELWKDVFLMPDKLVATVATNVLPETQMLDWIIPDDWTTENNGKYYTLGYAMQGGNPLCSARGPNFSVEMIHDVMDVQQSDSMVPIMSTATASGIVMATQAQANAGIMGTAQAVGMMEEGAKFSALSEGAMPGWSAGGIKGWGEYDLPEVARAYPHQLGDFTGKWKRVADPEVDRIFKDPRMNNGGYTRASSLVDSILAEKVKIIAKPGTSISWAVKRGGLSCAPSRGFAIPLNGEANVVSFGSGIQFNTKIVPDAADNFKLYLTNPASTLSLLLLFEMKSRDSFRVCVYNPMFDPFQTTYQRG
jgi:hypothetical protein